MVKLFEIIRKFEEIVPCEFQWEKDNSGLQVGDPGQDIKKILVSLELNGSILKEAIEKKADLIFTHHPFLFKPVKKIDYSVEQGKLLKDLIQNNIALYAAHTNLDKYENGVSKALAKKIGLKNIVPLVREDVLNYKIVTFVPEEYTEKVMESLSNAGAGVIGNYRYCSYRISGKGTFEGSQDSNPFTGAKGNRETIEEIRLEMVFPKWKQREIIKALKSSHPYEEPAYDIYSLKNISGETGLGSIGNLEQKTDIRKFLDFLKISLNIPFLRTSNNLNGAVDRIAILPGAGALYLHYAIQNKAEVFITSDITYHVFFEAMKDLILVDAGHFETEAPVLNEIELLLKSLFNTGPEIIRTENITNPIYYY